MVGWRLSKLPRTARRNRPPRLSCSAPWCCSRFRSRTRSTSTAPTLGSPPFSVWPFSHCCTSPRRAKSNACANGRAARPSVRPSSSRPSRSTPKRSAASRPRRSRRRSRSPRRCSSLAVARHQRRRQAQARRGRGARLRAFRGRARAARAEGASRGRGRRAAHRGGRPDGHGGDGSAAAPAVNGGGAGHPPVPKPATPAARRIEQPPPPPLPPRRVAAAAAGRRTTAAPPPRESNSRAVIITAVVGILVLAGAIFGITRLAGSDEEPAAPRDNVVATATPEDRAAVRSPPTTSTPAAQRDQGERASPHLQRDGCHRPRRQPMRSCCSPRAIAADNVGTGNARPAADLGRALRARRRRAPRRASPTSSASARGQAARRRSQAAQALVEKSPRRSGTWSRSSAPTSRTSPMRAMPLVARATFLVLVGATFSAFFVAQRLKSTGPVIEVNSLATYFSPNADGDRDTNPFLGRAEGARRRHGRRRRPRRRPRQAARRGRARCGPTARCG